MANGRVAGCAFQVRAGVKVSAGMSGNSAGKVTPLVWEIQAVVLEMRWA